jgi:hypothetical protein
MELGRMEFGGMELGRMQYAPTDYSVNMIWNYWEQAQFISLEI